MELRDKKLTHDKFMTERRQVLQTWETSKNVGNFEDGVKYQQSIPERKCFSLTLLKADQEGKTLSQPRAGMALMDEHITLLKTLQEEYNFLPSTIDTYIRLNRYEEATVGIQKSIEAGTFKLNGLSVVNHGVATYRRMTGSLDKPIQARHGTPDARPLTEIAMTSSFTNYEGGGISYNVPYARCVTLEESIRDQQYCGRLIGLYGENGIRVSREPLGPLTDTLTPPFMSHSVAIIEDLLALEQGVESITVGHGQVGSLTRDIAAVQALRELSHEYFHNHGFNDCELSTVFHQWMGGFPESETKAFSAIAQGATAAGMSGATKVITKSPHKTFNIPTTVADTQDLKASRQILNMVSDQKFPQCTAVRQGVGLIKDEIHAVLKKVLELDNSDTARDTVLASEAGMLDVPFVPAACNAGKIPSVHDNTGAIHILEAGTVPLPKGILALHYDHVAERVHFEGRKPSFQVVINDISAVSHSKLTGRPQ